MSPLLQILSRTPPWVWGVFITLIFLGYHQSKKRAVSRETLFVLPTVMIIFSLVGVTSSFGFNFLPFVAWVFGFVSIAALGVWHMKPSGIEYIANSRSYRIPGSWLPLALMMAIFSIKYVIGFASARGLSIVSYPLFVGIMSVSLGALSGMFMARAVGILRFSRKIQNDA